MKIVTMATPSYISWLYHFLSSIKTEVIVYRINFTDKEKRLIEEEFPHVIFRDHTTELIPHEKWNIDNKTFKVTYLKGLFCKKAIEEFKEPVLWSDCTELIIGDLNYFKEKFGEKGFRIKRDHRIKTKTFAALFGISDPKEADKFYRMCEQNKDEWFSDQIALGNLDLKEIERENWISFNYDENAKSWSDRGKNGTGKQTIEDIDYTEHKYLSKLSEKDKSYKIKYQKFIRKFNKPLILVHTDEQGWCYSTSTNKIAELLSDEFDFKFIYYVDKQKEDVLRANPQIVWSRCSSLRNRKLLILRPDLRLKSFTSITTGGELLDDRVSRNVLNHQEKGLIVQNKEAEFLSRYYMKEQKEIFILPNGCDIEKFKPTEKNEFILGWNGRAGTPPERVIKGYNFYKKVRDHLKYPYLELDGKNRIPFDELPNFYDKISLLVLPSNCEGCSNTINEALASGVPVLAFKCGWHGEVMEEFDDGIIWIERNYLDIAMKIKYLKENPKYLKELSKNARKFAERHSWEIISEEYRKAFRRMIEIAEDLPINLPELVPKNYMKVVGLKHCNLGKLERNGPILWFEEGTIREVPYSGKNKEIVDNHINDRFLKAFN